MSVLLFRRFKDQIVTMSLRGILVGVLILSAGLLGILLLKSAPMISDFPLSKLIFSAAWNPWKGQFGLSAFIVASLGVAIIALIFASPVSLLAALYLSECANRRLRNALRLPIDILAGVPSVVFGLVGVIVIIPSVSILSRLCGRDTTGYSILSGGILLAIMIMPYILSLSLEVLLSLPAEAREAAIALGATRWETVRHVVLKRSVVGLVAAVVLGFARAFGETIAVMMVVGNVAKIPHSAFDPAYPLPALIANNFGELMSIPRFDSALFLAALVLMIIVGIFSLAAQAVLHHIGRI
jgi:phosphate transport system permease protein